MTDRIRYAVVGLGDYIAQSAVLPAFAHAKRNSVLSALVSDDPEKLDALGRIGEVRMFTSEFTLQVGEGTSGSRRRWRPERCTTSGSTASTRRARCFRRSRSKGRRCPRRARIRDSGKSAR
jgi:hypothetical protein